MTTIQLRFRRSVLVRHGLVFGALLLSCLAIFMAMTHASWWLRLSLLLPLAAVAIAIGREYRFAARVVDDEGVTRADGRRFAWSTLQKINDVKMVIADQHTGPLNHIDMVFAAGRVRILPYALDRGYEAIQFIRQRRATPVSAAAAPPPPQPARCTTCGDLKDYHRAMQKGGRASEDTQLPAASGRLKNVKEVPPSHNGSSFVQQCPECGAWFLYKTTYEYLVSGSEDEQELSRISPGQAEEMMRAS